jgi:hypothetical protein
METRRQTQEKINALLEERRKLRIEIEIEDRRST